MGFLDTVVCVCLLWSPGTQTRCRSAFVVPQTRDAEPVRAPLRLNVSYPRLSPDSAAPSSPGPCREPISPASWAAVLCLVGLGPRTQDTL